MHLQTYKKINLAKHKVNTMVEKVRGGGGGGGGGGGAETAGTAGKGTSLGKWEHKNNIKKLDK